MCCDVRHAVNSQAEVKRHITMPLIITEQFSNRSSPDELFPNAVRFLSKSELFKTNVKKHSSKKIIFSIGNSILLLFEAKITVKVL